MQDVTRRDVLKTGVAVTAVAAASSMMPGGAARAEPKWSGTPEKDASIRVLRWKQFVQGDIDAWTELTKKFVEQTVSKVRVETESWEDIRPKAAVAANVGAGPAVIISTLDDPH